MADLVTGTEVDAADYRSSYANLATSVPQALELVERLSDKQLDKKINERFDEELITSAVDPVVLDDLTVTFIGPTPETLAGLKQAWLDEFKKKQDVIDNLRERMADDVTDLATGSVDLAAVRAARADLAVELGLSEGELGDRRRITAPNLASLMFVAEECDHKAIFTGDGAGQDIIAGLQERNFLAPGVDSAIHVSVLKLQHHGAEFNVDSDFLRRVTADHYLISGNGNHENPDARVLEAIADSRDENHPAFAVAAEAADPFTIDMAMGPEVVTAAFEEALDGIFEKLDRLAERFPADHMRIRRYENDTPVVIELT
jgi:hypothetical protein